MWKSEQIHIVLKEGSTQKGKDRMPKVPIVPLEQTDKRVPSIAVQKLLSYFFFFSYELSFVL